MQEAVEDDPVGWKTIRNDIFRIPQNPVLFFAATGSGLQSLIAIATALIVHCLLPSWNPATAGAVAYFTVGSFYGGLVSAHLQKTFGVEKWRQLIFFNALLMPR